MRINHNIPALNAYRNLSISSAANAKSMEKMSSGLRINRAADDAAGLAISETMRSQIRGLNQASRNSQDAISLLQTAEGGLTETHSILHRMRELAIQAANDTYTANDRFEIQKEVDQLKDELDRIANTTSFNNKNLLDGTASAITSSDQLSTKVIMRGGLRVVNEFGIKTAGGGSYKLDISATAGTAQIQKSNVFKNNQSGDSIQSLNIDTDSGISHIGADSIAKGSYAITTTANVTAPGATGALTLGQYYQVASSTASNLFASIIQGGTGDHNASILIEVADVQEGATPGTATNVTLNVSWYEYERNGNYYNEDGNFSTTAEVAMQTTVLTVTNGEIDAFTATLAGGSIGFEFDINQVGIKVGDKATYNYKASNAATTFYDSIVVQNETDVDTAITGGSDTIVDWRFDNDGLNNNAIEMNFFSLDESGNVSSGNLELTVDGYGSSAALGTTFTFEEGLGQVASLDTQLRDIDKFWDASGKFLLNNPETITLVQGNGKKSSITLFNTDTIRDVRDKLNEAIADGLEQGDMVTGDEQDKFVSYVTTADNSSVETIAGTFVVRSAQAGEDGVINIIGNEQLINALGFATATEATNSKFTVTVSDADDPTNTIASNVEISGNMLIGVVHENVDVKFDANADINVAYNETTKSFDLSEDTSNTYSTYVHLVDNSQVFQIGANELQDMGAAIGRMDTLALGVNNIIVTDRESAGRAVTKMDNAIGMVSAQRSSIGAVQNRLEHTINNLGVASENLTASESRIRDVDMAAEMMEFSKLNILSQAATAMLAQANQKPQSVLQLIQGS